MFVFPQKQLENTFILALDGDVEFRADSMMLMVEKMKESKKIGAVCGRVHPIGSGESDSTVHESLKGLSLSNSLVSFKGLLFGTNILNMLSAIGFKK